MNEALKKIIEALLLVSDTPLSVSRIQGVFDKEATPDSADIKTAIKQLEEEYEDRSIQVQKIGSGYRFQTRPEFAVWIRKLHAGRPPRLSRVQLETLAIIAYRQPVTRGDIEEIRGVAVSTEIMQRISERGWVKQVGVREVPGRPALYGTTREFLAYFNLKTLSDLPPLMDQREYEDVARDLDSPLPAEVLLSLNGATEAIQADNLSGRKSETDRLSQADKGSELRVLQQDSLDGDDSR